MRFGPETSATVAGALLVHAVRQNGVNFRKGRRLSAEDAEALVAAGIAEVTVVRLEAGDVPEDRAAERIAVAATGAHVSRQAAFTGRANLYAAGYGLAIVDRERVDRLNRIDEAVTIATVAPMAVALEKQMLATVKIIPFAAPEAAVAEAERIAGDGGPLVRIAPFTPHRAGLILTRLPGTKDSVLDKTAEVLRARLEHYGSHLVQERRCAHQADAVGAAVRDLHQAGCSPVLIFGASAITDRRDELPAGIEAAGGAIEHFGMPVDPGNLLLLGRLDRVLVVGLPGCARSPKLNGFDWVLERLLAGEPVGPEEIKGMGAGGLLMEIPSRPQPRGRETSSAPRAPRIGAVVLAAGQSRRMGAENKLLAEVDGAPLLRHAVDTALASQADGVIVVTGHEAERVRAELDGQPLTFTHNPRYAEGLSTSLQAGLAALPSDVDGAVILLGDMPRVGPEHIDRLIAAFNPLEGRAICVPTQRGKRGNPVLFAQSLFDEIRHVAGDVGARHLIGTHADLVCEVPIDDEAIFTDVDTPEALADIRGDST